MNRSKVLFALVSLFITMTRPVAAEECGGLTLIPTRLAIRLRPSPALSDRLALAALVVPADPATFDVARDGLTITVGDPAAPDCNIQVTNPVRVGSCYTYRVTAATGRVSLRLCQRPGHYALRYRVSRTNLSCLTQPRVIMTVESGAACNATGCSIGSHPIECSGVDGPTTTTTTTASSSSSTTSLSSTSTTP